MAKDNKKLADRGRRKIDIGGVSPSLVIKESAPILRPSSVGGAKAASTLVSGSTFASPLLGAIHETASQLVRSGLVTKQTMRELDILCLTPVSPIEPTQIRELREREGVSQAVLARYVNVSPNAVSQWERGEKRPSGSALKMLWLAIGHGLDSIR